MFPNNNMIPQIFNYIELTKEESFKFDSIWCFKTQSIIVEISKQFNQKK
jgi:hypothetical protein